MDNVITIKGRFPGFDDEADTILSEKVQIDWADVPLQLEEIPIGRILNGSREGNQFLFTTKVNFEFVPTFIIRKARMEGDKRIIEDADLVSISIRVVSQP